MTEVEWLACSDPAPMMTLLGRASARKGKLFSVACCYRIWPLLRNKWLHEAVTCAEQYADGQISREKLETVIEAVKAVPRYNCDWAGGAVYMTAEHDNDEGAYPAAMAVGEFLLKAIPMTANPYPLGEGRRLLKRRRRRPADDFGKAYMAEREAQSYLLRDVFGNPFRPVMLRSSWLTSTVKDLSAAIYGDRAFDRLPLLADALEDADCTNADILAHCRGPGPHVRGCWVVDLLLGKK